MITYTCDVCGKAITTPYSNVDIDAFCCDPVHLCPKCGHVARRVGLRDAYVTALKAAKQAEQPATPPRPLTNFDVITASPETLANKIAGNCSLCASRPPQLCDGRCYEGTIAHLTAPAKEAQADD